MTCGGCGAGLSVAPEARFVDCRYCGASLRIVRNESAVFTELNDRVRSVEGDVVALQKRSDLQDLDTRWAAQRMAYQWKGELMDGAQMLRHSNLILWICGAFALFMWLLVAWASSVKFQWSTFMTGLMVLLLGIAMRVNMRRRAAAYFAEEAEYRKARAAIESGS